MKLEKKTIVTVAGFAFGAIFFAWALQNWKIFTGGISSLFALFTPLFVGFCIAFVLNVPMRLLEKHLFRDTQNKALQRLRRPLAILISLCFIVAVLTMVCTLVLPELVNAFGVLGASMAKFFTQAQTWAIANAEAYPDLKILLMQLQLNWAEIGKTALTYLTNGATGLLSGATQLAVGFAGGIMQFVIAFIFSLYMLTGKERLKAQGVRVCRAFLPAKFAEALFYVGGLAKRTFASFVTGQCIEACILGTLCWLGMLLLRFPYAPMIGALVGVLALIPIVGAFIGTVVGAFMILMTGNWIQAIWFVVFLLVLQQIEGNLIYPRVVGSSVGLPPIWVLASVTLGGSLWGIVGMLFAVPLCSVLYALLRFAVRVRLGEATGADKLEAKSLSMPVPRTKKQ